MTERRERSSGKWKYYSKILISDNFKIIKLNWVRVSRTNRKTDSSGTKIINMGLNELMRMIIIFVTLFYH